MSDPKKRSMIDLLNRVVALVVREDHTNIEIIQDRPLIIGKNNKPVRDPHKPKTITVHIELKEHAKL